MDNSPELLSIGDNVTVWEYEFFNSPVHGIGCKSTQDIKEGDIVNKEPFFIVPRHIKNYANSINIKFTFYRQFQLLKKW